jgi:hypothetical protein
VYEKCVTFFFPEVKRTPLLTGGFPLVLYWDWLRDRSIACSKTSSRDKSVMNGCTASLGWREREREREREQGEVHSDREAECPRYTPIHKVLKAAVTESRTVPG